MGTNNSIDQNILNKEFSNTHSSNYMFCPHCFLIPLIKPFLMNGELYISLYCKCLYDEREYMPFESYIQLITKSKSIHNSCKKHKSIEGFLFCISCEKWLCDCCFISHKEKYPNHIYNKIAIRLREYCFIHEKENAIGYCNNCGKNICKICYETKIKLRHEIFMYNDKEHIINIQKKWESFIDIHTNYFSINEKLEKEIINLINNSKDISDEEKKKWNNKINDAYLKNKYINQKLSEYILFLFSNYEYSSKTGNIANLNIFRNIINIKYDNSTFSIKPDFSPIKNAEKLIKYYNNVHIIQLSSLVNIKNISSERKNVTKQISKICLLDESKVATLTSNGIIIIWNYITYDELYRIKKITVNEKNYFEKNEINNILNIANTMNDLNNYFFDLDDEFNNNNNNNNLLNERIIRQQTQILNQINNQNNNNNINNKENKRINIIKVYIISNSLKLNSNNNSNGGQQNNEINKINNNIVQEEEDLEPNFNFISMAFIKKYKLLVLIIENCKDIYLFDIKKKEALKQKLIGHKKEVLDILALKDNNLASYGNDHSIRIWNMNHFQNFITINVEIKKYHIYFTQLLYGNLIFASNESVIKILKLPEFEFDKDITCVPQPMNYFELPDKKLIIASQDFYVRILKPPDYKDVMFLFNKRTRIFSFLLLDKKRLLVSLEDNSLHIMFLNKKKQKNNMQSVSSFWSPIGSLVKTSGNRLISISWDNYIKIFLIGD